MESLYLVTGATGFLGQYLVERLAVSGKKVRAFCRRVNPELEQLRDRYDVEIAVGDVRSPADCRRACNGADAVFHTAARTGIYVQRRPFYETNVIGTENMLSAAIESGVRRFVFTGSPSGTDSGFAQEGIDESAPYPKKFLAYYPETKAIAEQKVLAANGTALPDGGIFSVCSLRPRLIWGPRDRNLIPRMIERAKTGHLSRIGDGTNRLDILYIDNAVDAHLAAMEALSPDSPVAGNAYFLSQNDPVNCWDFINRVLALAGIDPVDRSISFKAAWRIGACFEGVYRLLGIKAEPPMTRFLATQLAFSYWFRTDKARQDFGYVPKVSNEEGLRRLGEYLASLR